MRTYINSEGFLAEVFHPWVRWEGPGSGFENSSGAGGGVWKSRIHRFGPLGIEVEKQGVRTVRSKVSVKKSQIGFVVINFSRSISPYMYIYIYGPGGKRGPLLLVHMVVLCKPCSALRHMATLHMLTLHRPHTAMCSPCAAICKPCAAYVNPAGCIYAGSLQP